MPDEITPETAAAQSAQQNDDLEKLFAEAEAKGFAKSTQNTMQCKHCQQTTHRVCPTCKGPYCLDCASFISPEYCKLCLQEPDVKLDELPLKDEDGVTHDGRELKPSPEATFYQPRLDITVPDAEGKPHLQQIFEMTPYQLEGFIQKYQELVRQSEKALDFRRIMLGAAKVHKADLQDAERRRLRQDKTKYPVRTVSIDPKTGKQVAKQVSTANLQKLVEVLAMIQKQKEAKKP